jgi:ABC-2 type transport system ATP-binding protein
MINTPSDSCITVKNLNKSFGQFKAVQDISFTVARGDIYGFLGPNGAGKSTTMRMLVALIQPDAGSIEIFGHNLRTHRAEIMRKTGVLIERPDFYKYLSALQNLKVLASGGGISVSEKRMREVLDIVGLSGKENQKVKTFSQGMKQRLGLAQALMHNPDLLILDEPSNGLDPQGIREMRDLILNLNKEHGKTILLSSHLLYEIELMANRMLIINKGRVVVEGNVQELLNQGDITVRFSVSDVQQALLLLNKMSTKPVIVDSNTLIASLNQKQIGVANQLLVQHQIEVTSIKPLRALEEYFINLT